MNELVKKLTEGDHPVEASLRPEKTVQAFKECIDRRYVHIKFTDTKGGTDLGIRVDEDALDLSQADFEKEEGKVSLAGNLTLDYEKVRLFAEIDLATLNGTGHLELRSE